MDQIKLTCPSCLKKFETTIKPCNGCKKYHVQYCSEGCIDKAERSEYAIYEQQKIFEGEKWNNKK